MINNPVSNAVSWAVRKALTIAFENGRQLPGRGYTFGSELTLGGSDTGISVTVDKAMNYTVFWACVTLLAGTLASLPLFLYERLEPRGKKRATEHPLYRLLHDEPNSEMDSFSYIETLMFHLIACNGNCYSYIDWDESRTEIQALWIMDPSRTIKARDAQTGEIIFRYQTEKQGQVVLPAYRVWHIPGFGYDGMIGYTPLSYARNQIGLGLAAEKLGSKIFSNGLTFGGILEHPGKMGDEAQKRFKTQLEGKYQGVDKAFRLLILEEGMKYNKNNIPPNDAQWLECVITGTMISMADGTLKPVEQLKVGDVVIGWDNALVPARVSAIGKTPIKPLIKITTARGRELTASFDHPCLALRALRTPGCRKANRNPEWIPIGELEEGNYIRVALGNVSDSHAIFSSTAWLTGVLAGDGYLHPGGCTLSASDNGVIGKANEVLATMGGSLKKKNTSSYDYEIITNGSGRKVTKVRQFLKDSGLIGCHADNKRVPEAIFKGGAGAWAGFLSGYLDTDGSITSIEGHQQPKIYWSSINRDLLEDCRHLLELLGIQGAIYRMYKGGTKVINTNTCNFKDCWGLVVTGSSQIRKAANLLMPQHTEKAKRLSEYKDINSSKYTDGNFLYDRIIKVESCGEGETVGIEIDEYHTFVTSGLITHNTRKFQRGEIASFFHVPPHLIGDLDRATFSNIEEQSLEFAIYTMRPWTIRWERSLNRQLLLPTEKGRYFSEFLIDGILRGDIMSRYQAYSIGRNWGWLSADDVRELENMNPLPENQGNIYMAPSNMLPASEFEAQKPKPSGGQNN